MDDLDHLNLIYEAVLRCCARPACIVQTPSGKHVHSRGVPSRSRRFKRYPDRADHIHIRCDICSEISRSITEDLICLMYGQLARQLGRRRGSGSNRTLTWITGDHSNHEPITYIKKQYTPVFLQEKKWSWLLFSPVTQRNRRASSICFFLLQTSIQHYSSSDNGQMIDSHSP